MTSTATDVPSERVEPRLPTCPECQSKMAEPIPGPTRLPPITDNQDVIRGMVDKTATPYTHRPRAILQEYKINPPPFMACMFPGGHLHRHGFVVETFCGLTINIGDECAAASLSGFDAMKVEVRQIEAFMQNVQRIRSHARDLPQQIRTVQKDAEAIDVFRQGFENNLSMAHRDLKERATSGDARRLEVRVEVPVGNEKRVIERRLRGMEIWTLDLDVRALASEFDALVRAVGPQDELERQDREVVRKARNGLDRVATTLTAMTQQLDAARAFWSDENLALVVVLANRSDLRVEDGHIVLPQRFGQETMIGRTGSYVRASR